MTFYKKANSDLIKKTRKNQKIEKSLELIWKNNGIYIYKNVGIN